MDKDEIKKELLDKLRETKALPILFNGFRFRVQNNKIAVKMTCILAYKIASHFLLI